MSLIAAEDTRRTGKLLARYEIRTPTTSVREHNEVSRIPALVSRLKSGDSIALVSDAGTPTISDPGFKLLGAARDHHLRVEVVPGASAVLTALIASGFPTDRFTFLGFPPRKAKDLNLWLLCLASHAHTVVFFEAPHRVRRTLTAAAEVLGDRPVTLAREMTKSYEELVKGPIKDVMTAVEHPRGEFTVVVGPALSKAPVARKEVTAETVRLEFGRMTNNTGSTKRQQLASIAKRYGLKVTEAYKLLEQAKPDR